MIGYDPTKVLREFPLEQAGHMTYFIRQLLWAIATGLSYILDKVEEAVMLINSSFGGFWSSKETVDFINKLTPLILALFIVTLLFIAYQMFIRATPRPEIVQNLLIGIIVAVYLPTMLSWGYNAMNVATEHIKGQGETSAEEILDGNVHDVTLFDFEKGYDPKNPNLPGNNAENIKKINPSELVKDDKSDIWGQYLDSSGELKKVYNGGLDGGLLKVDIDFNSNRYYKYNIDFLVILVTEIVAIVAFTLSGIRMAHLIYELAVHQALANILAFLDISEGQRLKKCLQSIVATFATLFGCMFLLQLYIIGNSYISSHVGNSITKLLCLIALAWAVIDGPNIFEQILGVDAGLKSGTRALMGINAAAGLANKAGRGVKNIATGAGKVTGKTMVAAGATGGFMAGVATENASQFRLSNSDNTDDSKNKGNMDKNKISIPGMAKSSDGRSENTSHDKGSIGKSGRDTIPLSSMEKGITEAPSSSGVTQPADNSSTPSLSGMGENATDRPTSKDDYQDMTLGNYMKNRATNVMKNNKIVSTTHHAYQIGRNTERKSYEKRINKQAKKGDNK